MNTHLVRQEMFPNTEQTFRSTYIVSLLDFGINQNYYLPWSMKFLLEFNYRLLIFHISQEQIFAISNFKFYKWEQISWLLVSMKVW